MKATRTEKSERAEPISRCKARIKGIALSGRPCNTSLFGLASIKRSDLDREEAIAVHNSAASRQKCKAVGRGELSRNNRRREKGATNRATLKVKERERDEVKRHGKSFIKERER